MGTILIEGLPGIGKTTLVKKIISNLTSAGTEISGFFTEEIRGENNRRSGFDIVTLDNKRAALARLRNSQELVPKGTPIVGPYAVNLSEFESLALPVLESNKKVLVIDEIGKMELFSKKFEQLVKKIIFDDKNHIVIATVPLKDGGQRLIKQLKENKNFKLILVKENNRNELVEEVTKLVLKI